MGVFLRAAWRRLAMLNYEVEPELLRPRMPAGTELDAFQGKTYVSVVGFMFEDTRVKGIPVPFHRTFPEVNLRFYVRHRPPGAAADGSDDRRGVVFVKELVPRPAIAWLARALYHENYIALPMRHRVRADGRVAYGFRVNGRWCRIAVSPDGEPAPAPPGSEAEFITEHYWGYAAQPDGGTKEYQVEHPRWRVQPVRHARLDGDVAALYGPEFAAPLARPPASAFLADGSPVIVRDGVRIR